jgi:hypothetical protein
MLTVVVVLDGDCGDVVYIYLEVEAETEEE